MALSSLVADYDALILDLDGCVYVGEEATPGAPEAIEALRTEGKGVVFVTNDSRHAVEDYVQKLWRLGVRAAVADVVSVGAAVQHLLARTLPGRGAFVIGTEAFRRHVADAGLVLLNGRPEADHADVVIVAGPDELSYDDLRSATLSVRAGANFIATGRDSTYPMPDGLWPGTGAILAAVEYATDRRAEIVGKPEPGLFHIALDRLGPGRVLAVGDRLDADVAAAERAGLDAALVLTGATSAEEAERDEEPRPVVVAASLGALIGVS